MSKLATIDLKGNEYATVPTRLKAFREANPRASIATQPKISEDGSIMFTAKIVQDKGKDDSPEATGHSFGKNTGAKAFEKQETIAVGRALALLGYLNNGMVASTEEMEDFESFKAEKYENEITDAKTRDDLMKVWNDMDALAKKEFTPMFKERMEVLNGTKN